MVKHIILWNLKEEFNTLEIKAGIKQNLEGLVGVIDGLIEMKIETKPLGSSSADVMLYSVFESEEALKGYSKSEAHNKVADTFVRPYTAKRVAMDFVVE